MARNRQKAKERQARRKAQQQRQAGDGAKARGDGAPAAEARSEKTRAHATEADGAREEALAEPETVLDSEPEPAVEPEPPAEPEPEPAVEPEPEPAIDPHLRAGAPPEDVGRSDEVLDYEQDLEAEEADQEHFDSSEDFPEEDLAPGPRDRRAEAEKHKDRARFVQFLFAVWAELQRVQWPDRQALTTLTGVVLGFVLIAGGYLGLLDAIFSRIIQAIL